MTPLTIKLKSHHSDCIVVCRLLQGWDVLWESVMFLHCKKLPLILGWKPASTLAKGTPLKLGEMHLLRIKGLTPKIRGLQLI
jgi:hypothetical protein